MQKLGWGMKSGVILMVFLGALVPVGSYVWVIGRVPGVTAGEAVALLEAPDSAAVLVDIRPPEEFEKRRIRDSINWPWEEIRALERGGALPERLRGKQLLLLCDSGILSAVATQRLRGLGQLDALNVRDGIRAYNTLGGEPLTREELAGVFTGTEPVPYRDSPWYEQWSLFLTGFFVKPGYMLLSLALIVVLWKTRAADLVALKWALIFFLAGELACMINYLVFTHQSHLSEFLHSYGMVLAFGFGMFAVIEGIDMRLIQFSDPEKNCAALPLCRACQKRIEVPCALKRIFLWLIPMLFVLAFMPFCSMPRMVSYNTKILLSKYHFTHPAIYQIFEVYHCPVFAMVLLAVSFFVLWFKKADPVAPSKVFFSAGVGALGFCFLRYVLFGLYGDNLVWFNSWEEITELMATAGVAVVLWVFRQGLFPDESPSS